MKAKIFLFVLFTVNLLNINAQDPIAPKVTFYKITNDNLNNIDYKIARIQYQDWIIEGIRNTLYSDNTKIKLISENNLCDSISFVAYCVIDNHYLYNGYAIETDKICPYGWRIASTYDYKKLATFLNKDSMAFKKYSYIMDTLPYSESDFRQVHCIKK